MAFPTTFPILVLLHLCTITFAATDTISRTQPLSGDITVVSKEGNFELGFFSPGNNGNFYVGIWFRTISKRTAIWVANRDIPVSNASSPELKISMDGNIVLNSLGAPIWSSNSTRNLSRSTIAVLLDSGNPILRDQYNSSDIFWQSFDHPTDTVVSGQWFGIDKITREYQNRVSWKDQEDPAPGPFSFHADLITMSQYVSVWNHMEVYWQSGSWTGKAFTSIPGMPLKSDYSYNFVNNSRELKFRWTTKDASIITRIILSANGQLQRHTWSNASKEWIIRWYFPAALCDVYSVCGPFGICRTGSDEQCFCLPGFRPASSRSWNLRAWNQGCVRQTDIQCADSNKSTDKKVSDAFLKMTNSSSAQSQPDKFYIIESVRLPDNAQTAVAASSQDCRVACLNNCSCNAYTYNSSGCFVWHVDLMNLQEQYSGNGGGTLFLRLAASELPDSKKSKTVIIGTVVGGVAAVLIVLAIVSYFLFQKYRRERTLRISKTAGGTLIAFRYSDLQHVTNNFAERLGGGAFGSVFKGTLPDSTAIAVKRLDGVHQGEKQFRAEVSTIGTVQHVNLVRLLGFCSEGSRRLLAYEFMPKGSLDLQLFPSETTALSWATRYQIALGTARGLNYLNGSVVWQ